MAYAKAAYVRDIQVSEKKHIREMEIEEEKRKDVMMEIERLKGLEKDIKKEELRKSQQVQGKAVIVDQIKEREYQRMKAREEQGKEGQEMLKKIKMREEEEVKDLQAKKVHQSIVFNEMVISNEEQMKKKEEIKRKEKEETEKVMQYLLDKQKRDDEKREEMMRIKQEKEHEIQKLREAQEKASDRFQEVDNIRARRAVEKAERAARDKDRKEAEKKSRM